MESLIDGLVAVEEEVASFLRLSLFAVLVVGIFIFSIISDIQVQLLRFQSQSYNFDISRQLKWDL